MKPVLRILAIEDSEDDAFLVIRQIKKGGYVVEYDLVDTIEKMKEALTKKTWDIILSDYKMNNFNGLDALKILKESGIDIPFIIISGTIGEETAVEAMKAGARDYIMKNSMQRLLPAVERELRESRNRTKQKMLEQKQLRAEALKESEAKYHEIFDNISDGIFLLEVTEDGRFKNLEMNTSFVKLTGIDPNLMLGKYIEEVLPEATFHMLDAKYRQCVESGQPVEEETELNLPVGKRIFLSSLIPVRNESGRIYRIVGINHDITKRKQTKEALLESEDRYRQLVEMSPDSIAIHQQGRIVYINTAGVKLFGAQNTQEMIGKSVLDLVHPDYRNNVIQRIEKTLIGENTPYYEEKFLKLDGTPMDVGVTAIPSVFQGKEATQVVVHNISERKRAEAEIKQKNEELIRLNAEKDKFFSIIAHDLRGPFSGFLGLSELLVENVSDLTIDKIQKFAVNIRDSASNLFRLLENLLQWASMQQGLISVKPEFMHLYPVVNECSATLLDLAKTKNIEIAYNIPHELTVFTDGNILQTILRNLVSNSIKFTPIGGKITISAKTADNKNTEISVKDTGIGMSPAMVNNLFRMDVRTNRIGTEGEPSSGLGLLLCKESIEKLGGKIWVESEEGKGTTFYFIIP
jgi:PAS domain S-box-containing protein